MTDSLRRELRPALPWVCAVGLMAAGVLASLTWFDAFASGLLGRSLLVVVSVGLAAGSLWALRRERVRVSADLRRLVEVDGELAAVRRTEETLRLAIEAAPCGMIMVDGEGRIEMVNAETERLFGYDRSEMIDRKVEMLVPANLRDVHRGHRKAYVEQPSARLMGGGRDLHGLRKDGDAFPVEVGLNPITTPNGAFVFGAVTDITERVRTEQELLRQTEELKRSNAELEQFAYVASHDLQEPLRMVASFTGLLAERYRSQLDERAHQYIHHALDGSQRMQRLIRDLLAYSRINSQRRPRRPVDSADVMTDVLRDLSTATLEAHAEIECGELPTVVADRSQLLQVFSNLISNALKFRSQQAPRIRVSAEETADSWVFSVADNGIGIDPAYEERVFQMFQRLHEREKYPGSGIGLAIAKRIVERHGGRIWFESVPDEGCTFHFSLPKAASDRLVTATAPEEHHE